MQRVSRSYLRSAAENGHVNVVNRLLEIPNVLDNAGAQGNFVLRWAARNSHNKISYMLAKAQWPKGVVDMPDDLHGCLPAIYQGALMVSGEKEFEGMVKCWVRGKPISTTSDVHYPRHDSYSKNLVRRDDADEEGQKESMVDHDMNALLYSSRLHKEFQDADEEGQKESKERAGYGAGAMVTYSSGNRNRPGM